jgi:hypothetical protein
VAHAIEIAGVEKVDALLQRLVDGGDAFGAVGRAVKGGHSHAAQAKSGNLRARSAQRTLLDH